MKILKSSKKQNYGVEKKAQRILDAASKARPEKTSNHNTLSDALPKEGVEVSDFGSDFEPARAPKSAAYSNKKRKYSRAGVPKRKTRNRSVDKASFDDIDDGMASHEEGGSENPKESGAKSEYKFLMHKAIQLLSMREHSVDELSTKLQAKSDDQALVYAVMDFLVENDYVSDARFTEAFVRSRANKGQGPTKIRADLKAKGVDSVIIDEHLDPSAALWFDNALSLYAKKYGDEPVSDYNTWSKRARFMQSRGFTMDQIQSTVPQVNTD